VPRRIKAASAFRLKRDEMLRELVRTGKAKLPPPASRPDPRRTPSAVAPPPPPPTREELEASILAETVREEERLLDEARYVFSGIGLSKLLEDAIRVQLEFEQWEERLLGHTHPGRCGATPIEFGGLVRNKDGRGWPLADFVRKVGPAVICGGSLGDRIAVLREIYSEAPRMAGSARAAGEFRRKIESEMEAFGRALVTTLGHPKDVRDRSPRKRRPRRPDVTATRLRLAAKQREIERARELVPGKAWNPKADAIKALAREDRVTSAAIRKRESRTQPKN
jgi:hypothetical protein